MSFCGWVTSTHLLTFIGSTPSSASAAQARSFAWQEHLTGFLPSSPTSSDSIPTLWPRRSFKAEKLAVFPACWRCCSWPEGRPQASVLLRSSKSSWGQLLFSTPPSQAQELCPFPEHSSHLPCPALRPAPFQSFGEAPIPLMSSALSRCVSGPADIA